VLLRDLEQDHSLGDDKCPATAEEVLQVMMMCTADSKEAKAQTHE